MAWVTWDYHWPSCKPKQDFESGESKRDKHKVAKVNAAVSYLADVDADELRETVRAGRLSATTDFACLSELRRRLDLTCRHTLTANKEPDISAIVRVTKTIARYSHANMLVVLESTSYPGTTEEIIAPELTKSGLRVGQDLHVAFSPERVDPGNPSFKTHNTFKLVGGMTSACCQLAGIFYEQSISNIFPVSSTRVAEMTKVFENVFRSVNIALVNELALLCDRMGIDVYEVIQAAATKNFGFMPFYPGPGVGRTLYSSRSILFILESERIRSAHAVYRVGRRNQ